MKYLLLVGDGMGGYPVAEHGDKTSLELANTPFIDSLCKKGELFFNHTIPAGFPPGSDVANMSLMGYDPAKYYTGRAPLEAAAMGIDLKEDELAYRCNMVTLDFQGESVIMEDFSAGHITTAEAHELIAGLQAHCADEIFQFFPGVSYRNLVVFKGEHPGFATVPPHDHIGKDVTEIFNRYLADPVWTEFLAKVKSYLATHPLNKKRIKEGKLPCNMLWLWGEGKKPAMPKLAERFGITGTMVSAVDLLKGLGVLGGLDTPEIDGATGYIDTNYEGKAQAALEALKTQDFVFVHLEAPDESGHNGRLDHKIQAIEDFDQKIVKTIVEELRRQGESFRVVVTMDHFTPLALRTHTSDPVPTLLYDSSEEKKGCGLDFSEKTCAASKEQGTKSLENGYELVHRLFKDAN